MVIRTRCVFCLAIIWFADFANAHNDRSCLLAAGVGSWEHGRFTPSASESYHDFFKDLPPQQKPRIFMIGDSINREMVKGACRRVGMQAERYLKCDSDGSGFACLYERFELANLFFFGTDLDATFPKHAWSSTGSGPGGHRCDDLPLDTRGRFEITNLRRAMTHLTGEPDVVVVSAMLWVLQHIQDTHTTWSTFFSDRAALSSFSIEYVHNMTYLVRAAQAAYPRARFFIQKLPGAANVQGRLIGPDSVRHINKLAHVAAYLAGGVCVLDLEEMAHSAAGIVVIDNDGRHPTHEFSMEVINMLLNIAVV